MPSQELSHFSLAVEDKNTFFAFFKKSTKWYGWKMAVLGRGYLSQVVLESS